MTRVTLDSVYGIDSRNAYSRKNEEYAADFCLVSRRFLNPEEHAIFKFHFLLGADWKLCCRRLKIERGVFFHSVYRIQHRLGRAFRELEPYSLYPLSEYFAGEPKVVTPIRYSERRVFPIRPPVLGQAGVRPHTSVPTRKSA